MSDRLLRSAPRYLIVGIINTTLGLGIILTARLFMEEWAANALGYLICVPISFFAHRRYSFRDQGDIGDSLILYSVVVVLGLGLNAFVLNSLLVFGVHGAIAQITAVASYVFWTWAMSGMLVFCNPKEP